MAYIANTPDDERIMLERIGLETLDDLFRHLPEELRLNRPLDVPAALSELELTQVVGGILARNHGADQGVCFLGGGAYDHFVPAIVDQLAGRGEFFTAYTPYQPEASQGTLQAVFEYQTLICQLTGMEVSNSSLYDGASAAAEAMFMAISLTGRHGKVVVAETVHPEYRQVLGTFLESLEPVLEVVPATGGVVDARSMAAAVDDRTAAVVFQHPNFLGGLEDARALVAAAHAKGALAIEIVDPMSLGLLAPPSSHGVDIVVGEGQCLGNPLCYGGPYLGILACRGEYVRKMPGRIVGETVDRDGKRCWVLALQTREQHIRREKATSNIFTNQGLLALRASIYLAVMGPRGLRLAAESSTRKAHYAASCLAAIPGFELAFPGAFFKEFVIRTALDPNELLANVLRQGYHGGIALGRFDPSLADCILIAVTEKRTREEIDGLVRAFERASSDLQARTAPTHRAKATGLASVAAP